MHYCVYCECMCESLLFITFPVSRSFISISHAGWQGLWWTPRASRGQRTQSECGMGRHLIKSHNPSTVEHICLAVRCLCVSAQLCISILHTCLSSYASVIRGKRHTLVMIQFSPWYWLHDLLQFVSQNIWDKMLETKWTKWRKMMTEETPFFPEPICDWINNVSNLRKMIN